MRKLFPTAVAIATVIGLAGCAPAENFDADSVALEVSTEAPLDTSATEAESVDNSPDIDAEEVTETGSSSLDMTDEEVVLAALMGPDGEYAAAASYLAVLDAYGSVEPYGTIYEAELRHADALVRQLERLGVEVPENPYLGEITAPADLEAAALAWAEGEILNVELYDYLLTMTDNAQLTKVLNNLRSASLNSHLPAFEAAAANGGVLESFSSDH